MRVSFGRVRTRLGKRSGAIIRMGGFACKRWQHGRWEFHVDKRKYCLAEMKAPCAVLIRVDPRWSPEAVAMWRSTVAKAGAKEEMLGRGASVQKVEPALSGGVVDGEHGRGQGSGSCGRAQMTAGAAIGQAADRPLRRAMIARCCEGWGGRGENFSGRDDIGGTAARHPYLWRLQVPQCSANPPAHHRGQ